MLLLLLVLPQHLTQLTPLNGIDEGLTVEKYEQYVKQKELLSENNDKRGQRGSEAKKIAVAL